MTKNPGHRKASGGRRTIGCIIAVSLLAVLILTGTSRAFLPEGFEVYFTDPEQYCGDPNALDSRFMNFISGAEDSVNACFFEIRWVTRDCHPNPVETFCAISESVQVQIISDHQFDASNADYDTLKACGIEVAYDSMGVCPGNKGYSMHNKMCVVDGRKVWTGSTNNTYSGCWWNNNASIVIDCPELAQAYEQEFHEMWGTILPSHSDARFHTCKFGHNPVPDTAECNGVAVEYYFSPPSCIENRIVSAINNAQENIYFCVYVFTSDDIRTALINAHNRGVWVEGVVDTTCLTATGQEYNILVSAGVPVCYVAYDWGFMHHKFMVVDHNTDDDPKVLLGSGNYTYSADALNDENMLVVHDQNVAALYYNEFRRIRDICSPLAGGVSGTVTLDDNIYIGADTTALITVADDDSLLNKDPAAVDTAVVTVQSQNTDTVGELIALAETGINTGEFTGTLGFETSAVASNGRVAAVNGETITVTYSDALDFAGQGKLATDQAVWYAAPDSFPKVYVNELYPDPATSDDGSEFIEIYNPGPRTIDLSGWRLQDRPYYSADIWEFPEGTILAADEYLVVAKDGSAPPDDGFLEEFGFHADFELYESPEETTEVDDSLAVNMIQVTFTTSDNEINLSPTSDGLYIFIGSYYNTGIVVDSLAYDTGPGTENSIGRCPDGGDSIRIFTTPTPDGSNCIGPVDNLTAMLSDTSVVLIWSPATGGSGADHYVVYRDTVPNFNPQPADSIGSAADTFYLDDEPGVVGDTGRQHFYVVKAVDAGGYKSDPSNVAGEFDAGLRNGEKGGQR
jgi:phosphatidylserine/phosphatidylglycerophosphate/cardiolipin synthase-like enzyme